MRLYHLSFLCCLFFCTVLFSQEYVTYYNSGWKPCDKEVAVYASLNKKENGGWHRTDYYLRNQQVQMVGFYKDSANTIKQGKFQYFFPNGQLEKTEQYSNDKREGAFISLYPNGFMRDSFYFKNDIPSGICISWYPSGDVQTEMQMDSSGNGKGVVIGFFQDGTVSFKGRMGKGLRKTGNWFYYHSNGNKASILLYPKEDSTINPLLAQVKKDELENTYADSTITYTNASCYDLDGVQKDTCNIQNKTSEFPNGLKGWTSFLENEMYKMLPFLPKMPGVVSYRVYFMVYPDGKISDVMLDNKVDPVVDKEILRLFNNMKKWMPAHHHNRDIPNLHIQSMSFSLQQG